VEDEEMLAGHTAW